MSSFITFVIGFVLLSVAIIQAYLRSQTPPENRSRLQLVSIDATAFIGGFMLTSALLHGIGN